MAGISFSKALSRRRLLNRIDGAIEAAPPQSRSSRVTLAAHARAGVSSPLSAAIEAELASLADSDLADDEWLEAIARIRPEDHSTPRRGANHDLRIRALVLLCAVKARNAGLFASRAAVPKKSRPAKRSHNALRSDPFDPLFLKYPVEPSVLDAVRAVRS
jgi:hypothetical protein